MSIYPSLFMNHYYLEDNGSSFFTNYLVVATITLTIIGRYMCSFLSTDRLANAKFLKVPTTKQPTHSAPVC